MRTRALVSEDHAFLFDSWLRSFRGSHESGPYPKDLYYPTARATVERLLARSSVDVLVVEDEASDVLCGYIVHEPNWRRWSKRKAQLESFHVVHFTFVRELARGRGLAAYLLTAAGVRRASPTTAYSFSTPAVRGFLGQAAKFLPDAARYESKPLEAVQGAETT